MELLVQYLRELGAFKLFAMISGFLVIIGVLIIFSTRSNVNELVPLYSNLDMTDAQKIITDLEAKEIPYQIRANGTEILVPAERVLRLRMSMASQGLPSKGSIVGYEIFDKSDMMGTSNFVQNVNLIRALEGELARTIGSFASIESARVHLVLPKKELFSREALEPSASVVIKMASSSKLSKEQINAIVHLVATAVSGLDTKNITVVDTVGRSLKLGTRETDDATLIASSSEEFRVSHENRLKNVIEELIEQSVGVGKVKAQVSAEMNFDRIVTNSETYDPDGQVVRSIKESEDKESTNEKDSPTSVATNIPNTATTANAQPLALSSTEHTDTVTNYEISKTVKNHVTETGTIKRLSIAVLVDGTYKYDKVNKKTTYTPRTEDELSKYATLIKSAVGFDASRNDTVEVVNMSFVQDLSDLEDDNLAWIKRELPSIIQTFVIGAVVVMILLMVVRPIAIRAFEATKHDMAEAESHEDLLDESEIKLPEQESLPSEQEPMIDIAKIEAKFKSNSGNKAVNDIVGKYPQETLNAMRKWISKN